MSKSTHFYHKKLAEWVEKRFKAIWKNLLQNHLWQRIFKITLATTITIILAFVPPVVRIYGSAIYLAPMTTVFGHPGRRFGMMAEALVLVIFGTLVGIGWSTLGVYLSSLVYETNKPAAYTIKGIFLAVALLIHGFLRSHTPRLFIFVLLLVIVSVVSLTGQAVSVSLRLVTTLLYPILTAAAILLLVNTLVFPEFSSSFLGITTIETLGETMNALRDAGRYFVTVTEEKDGGDGELQSQGPLNDQDIRTAAERPEKETNMTWFSSLRTNPNPFKRTPRSSRPQVQSFKAVKLKALTDSKARLRAKLASCKVAQQECNFELAWAVLPPRDLKPISNTAMKKLVANIISLIGACESKYALMGDASDRFPDETTAESHLKATEEDNSAAERDFHLQTPRVSRPATTADSPHDGPVDEKESTQHKRRWGKNKKRRNNSRSKSKTGLGKEIEDLEMIKPKKEIEFSDIELLKSLVYRISKPLADLQEHIDRSVDVVTSCLAYCYDVEKLPNGRRPPSGIQLEEIDIRVDILTDAMADFDKDSASALESAASLHNIDEPQVDVMPRMETFLISSFLLNLRQAALHTLEMLKHSREIVQRRQLRHNRPRLYWPKIKWRKWLNSGGEAGTLAIPENARKNNRSGGMNKISKNDDGYAATEDNLITKRDTWKEKGNNSRLRTPITTKLMDNSVERASKVEKQENLLHRLRNTLADMLEYLAGSEDVLYAIKLTVAVFAVTWPAFVYRWTHWYYLNRGLWAALQLVLVAEVAIGTSVWTFILRAAGTTIGCVWGYAAFQARNGNPVVCVVILVIGIIPSAYVQLGSKYVKAGMVSIISMSIVALATVDHTVPGTATENFLRRLIAFLIGGIVALVVELVLFPVKARDRLVESLATAVSLVSEMEACLAYGIESETNVSDVYSQTLQKRFENAKSKAKAALTAAETILPFCSQEPRLKGSFKGLALIYTEILYVIHAVVDRMDNMLHLRYEYGSGVLEELNDLVYPYRRNVAASITLVLFAVHEALTTKLSLPQFLPSARLAHLRMVNRVREIVIENAPNNQPSLSDKSKRAKSDMEVNMVRRVVRQKFLSWNAASAGQIEVIEYLEELIDLVKLLVGANEFRSGLLTRGTYRRYVERMDRELEVYDTNIKLGPENSKLNDEKGEANYRIAAPDVRGKGLKKRSTFSRKLDAVDHEKRNEELSGRQGEAEKEELPRALQRVRTRRLDEMSRQKYKSADNIQPK